MANSVMKDIYGPDWPLGLILCATPGTPVNIMSLVDSSNFNSPNTLSSSTTQEYSPSAWEIQFTPCKAGASHGLAAATGNVYIVRAGVQGAGNRDDLGAIVAVLGISTNIPAAYRIRASSGDRNMFSPYRYYIDADVAAEGALVSLVICG